MKNTALSLRVTILLLMVAWQFYPVDARAQTTWQVTDEASWQAAIAGASSDTQSTGVTDTIQILNSFTVNVQQVLNGNANILGGGFTLTVDQSDLFPNRALFIFGGTVSISDLTITGGWAEGGSTVGGGGAGAGLGGAIFIGGGSYATGDGSAPVQGVSTPNVTLTNMIFSNNQASGGGGYNQGYSGIPTTGGGGGMGGDSIVYGGNGGTGGGGIASGSQAGAYGGGSEGGNGTVGGISNVPGNLSAGAGGSGSNWIDGDGGSGGANGGGGGGGGGGDTPGAGGGGGILGGRGYYENSNPPNGGGAGGFGGGGGGSVNYTGGAGGFAGGGGAGVNGGTGGFGGGGGAGSSSSAAGGFGGGTGQYVSGNSIGGGGLGAGGAVFVMAGATVNFVQTAGATGALFQGNGAEAGISNGGATNGSSYGNDLFLGANVTFTIESGSVSTDSLGGAGNTSDPNVSAHASDANAQGGVIKQGAGTLTLTGNSYYTGQTVIHNGTLALAAGALEQGSSGVIVGQVAGDNGTLAFLSGSTLNLTGSTGIVLGQVAGATGTVIIGQDGQEGAFLGLETISGGAGGGQVIFAQASAAGGPGAYPMLSKLTGNLSVVQNGPGTTILSPLEAYGNNTYTGGTFVHQGTLQINGANALGTSGVQVSGGTLMNASGIAMDSSLMNQVTITAPGGQVAATVAQGGSYAGLVTATSSFGNGRSTKAIVQGGTASVAATLTTSFAATSTATNDVIRLSDVYSFSGTGSDIFVLELSMTSVEAGSYLGWLNTATNQWVNAVEGNTGNNATAAQQGFLGSYEDFLTAYQGEQLADYIGAYGVDTSTDPGTVTVWAVLNHNSDFSIVPEPSTWALLLAGGVALATALRRRQGNVA